MDKTDIMIFRSLLQGDTSAPLSMEPRKSYRAIARNLRIDELTVRSRIQKLRRMGFLKGWRLWINPTLLGLYFVELLVDVSYPSREDLIEKLRLLPGIVVIVEHVGNSMYVILSCRDDADEERQISLVQKLAGANSSHFIRARFPNCNLRLSSTDSEIVRALTEDPRKRLTAVAEEIGISSRTVKRRMDRLIEGKAMFVVPSMDPSLLEGALLVDLLVQYSDPKDTSRVNQRIFHLLNDYLIRATGDSRCGLFNLIITRVSKIRDILSQVRPIAGVASARIDIVQDRLELYGQYPKPLQEKR